MISTTESPEGQSTSKFLEGQSILEHLEEASAQREERWFTSEALEGQE